MEPIVKSKWYEKCESKRDESQLIEINQMLKDDIK